MSFISSWVNNRLYNNEKTCEATWPPGLLIPLGIMAIGTFLNPTLTLTA